MGKYRTIPCEPEVVEAEQYLPEKNQIPKGVGVYKGGPWGEGTWCADTTNGLIAVKSGYWVITDEDNLSYVMEDNVFRARYEEIKEQGDAFPEGEEREDQI